MNHTLQTNPRHNEETIQNTNCHMAASAQLSKVSKGAKIRNRYNQVSYLTQDINGKVTYSQLDTTNESQEVSPFPAGDHKAHITDAYKGIANTRQKNIKYQQKNGQQNILLEGLNQFNGALTSPLVQMWIKIHRCLVCMKDP